MRNWISFYFLWSCENWMERWRTDIRGKRWHYRSSFICGTCGICSGCFCHCCCPSYHTTEKVFITFFLRNPKINFLCSMIVLSIDYNGVALPGLHCSLTISGIMYKLLKLTYPWLNFRSIWYLVFGLLYDPILSSEIIKLDHLEVLCMAYFSSIDIDLRKITSGWRWTGGNRVTCNLNLHQPDMRMDQTKSDTFDAWLLSMTRYMICKTNNRIVFSFCQICW